MKLCLLEMDFTNKFGILNLELKLIAVQLHLFLIII